MKTFNFNGERGLSGVGQLLIFGSIVFCGFLLIANVFFNANLFPEWKGAGNLIDSYPASNYHRVDFVPKAEASEVTGTLNAYVGEQTTYTEHLSDDGNTWVKTDGTIYILEKEVWKKTNRIALENWKLDIARQICDQKWDCATAIAVAYAESGLNCGAISPTNDHGVFQLYKVKEYDCEKNIDIAYEMYSRRGFQPWSAYKNGAYKKYLNLIDQL
jgi:hypothetical protein